MTSATKKRCWSMTLHRIYLVILIVRKVLFITTAYTMSVSNYMLPSECFEGQQLDTLDHFVVTDPEAGEFEKAVRNMLQLLEQRRMLPRDGSYRAEGKTLSGLGNDGRLHQTIIITSAICRQAIMEVAFMLGYLNMDGKLYMKKAIGTAV